MRCDINAALKHAIDAGDERRVSTLRFILAAIKERDIAARAEDRCQGACDDEILEILYKMVRQREAAAVAYEETGRLDLAEQERSDIDIIRPFLPRQLSEEEIRGICETVLSEIGARGLRDMGKCMCALKERYEGQMDFTKASTFVKTKLAAVCRPRVASTVS